MQFKTILFKQGDLGYHTYRIPALLNIPGGPIVAFAEGRKNNSQDHSDIQLVMRRSFDGGETWEPIRILLDYTGILCRRDSDTGKTTPVRKDRDVTCGNPCLVYDRETKRLWLAFNLDNLTMWVTYSDDNGSTWAEPRNITSEVFGNDVDFWRHIAAGPGHGIQTSTGRLIIPCDHQFKNDGGYFSMLVVSDDHGKSWQFGELSEEGMNECEVCELLDNEIYWNMRSYRRKNLRAVAYSKDDGDSFTGFVDDEQLIEPVCQGSIIRYDHGEHAKENIVLFSNPASKTRDHMTIKISNDGARKWDKELLLHEGPAAYSELAYLDNGEICCLYEAGENHPYETIVFEKVSWDSLNERAILLQ